MRNLLEASHELTTSRSLRHFSPALVLGGDVRHRRGRLELLVLSIGLVCALVAGSALLRVRQEVFDYLQNRGCGSLRRTCRTATVSHLSFIIGVCIALVLGYAYATDASLVVLISCGAVGQPPSSGGSANGRWCPRVCRGRVVGADLVSARQMSLTDK